ncbi:hypothetical protein [Aquibaculum arenosum]|uniref:Uncharacterized protein n=1 Tax=Aquibaculum arenosum TaxID=3032591 RepID=A0ABT5YLR3_9PROT|nr:hypothetical protein [Fodinicurvata sp. CAU 1616]MDF2095771.1 hypothetical protein [Fodinicurvata sp. CAU 1616]
MWMIYPVAGPDDARWQGRPVWERVVVEAETPALARLRAAALERPANEVRLGNESLRFHSAFEDEKLYWVRPLGAVEAAACRGEAPDPPLAGVVAALPRRNQADLDG